MHDLGIAHRDIKPENIVISNVHLIILRMSLNYVILVGLQCVTSVEKLIVVLLIMWLLKF